MFSHVLKVIVHAIKLGISVTGNQLKKVIVCQMKHHVIGWNTFR